MTGKWHLSSSAKAEELQYYSIEFEESMAQLCVVKVVLQLETFSQLSFALSQRQQGHGSSGKIQLPLLQGVPAQNWSISGCISHNFLVRFTPIDLKYCTYQVINC